MVAKACGVLYCPVEALAPSPPGGGLSAELFALDTFAGIVDNVRSVGAPCLESCPLYPTSPRELAGSAVLGRP